MTPSPEAISPLRQRMTEDMRMRKLELKTRAAYLRAVKKLADFLKRSPDTATVEDLRRFQLYLVDQGTAHHDQRHHRRPEVLLRHHPGPQRVDVQDADRARAAEDARRAEPR
jgi:hypothetical protein